MEGLRARDDVGRAVRKPRCLRVCLDEAHVLRRRRLLGVLAHLRARLDAHDLVGALRPDPRREPRAAAEVDHQPRPIRLRLEAQHVQQRGGRGGPVLVETMRETATAVAGIAQELFAPVIDQLPRLLRHPRVSLKWTPVSAAASARARVLPHGPLDLLRQLAIWFGFLYAYRYTRGVADRDSYEAFQNGLRVADVEHRLTGLWELSLQSMVIS